jgi:hypothetical protein
MARKIVFTTAALGSEPGLPGIGELAGWVGSQRGKWADLISYLLEGSLSPQQEAGIDITCAGGVFYKPRLLESLIGITGLEITGELGVDHGALQGDCERVQAMDRASQAALPAPHLLGLRDAYYGDEEEAAQELYRQYRAILRTMRDAGIPGHVLVADHAEEGELASLAGRKAFYFVRDPDRESLARVLEHQQWIAVKKGQVDLVAGLREEYDIAGAILMDPDEESLRAVLEILDPGQVKAGGYCTGDPEVYWKDIAASAVLSR